MIKKTLINHPAYRGWYYWIQQYLNSYDIGYWEYHNLTETYFYIR